MGWWECAADHLDAVNRAGQRPQVELEKSLLGNASGSITVVPASVNIYKFSVAQ